MGASMISAYPFYKYLIKLWYDCGIKSCEPKNFKMGASMIRPFDIEFENYCLKKCENYYLKNIIEKHVF